MQFSLKNILIILSLGFYSVVKAQFYSPSADTAYPTAYKILNKPDSIFIFSSINADKSIIAYSPDSTEKEFIWSVYHVNLGYNEMIKTEIGITSSLDNIISNQGYQVIIGGIDTFRCWVFIYDFDLEITSTIDDTIPNSDINCRTITYIKAEITDNDLFYYNPATHAKIDQRPNNDILWSCDPKEAGLPSPKKSLQVSVEDPYWLDTKYIITVTNNDIKKKKSDTAYYKSVRPHAEFAVPTAIKLDDSAHYSGRDPWYYEDAYNSTVYLKTSAPALFLLDAGLSKNYDDFTWIFGDSLTLKTAEDTIFHTYELPGTYYAYLIARKNVDFLYDPCYDTFPKEQDENYAINLNVAFIDTSLTPNVFTPKYEYWRFKEDVSLADFEIVIFNRFGNSVYHYKGNIRDWPGWDGTNDGKSPVSTGVYYYVVKKMKALPDFVTDELPKDLVLIKKGFIQVFR